MSLQLIKRIPGETFLIIRSTYVELCNGNTVAASLIHIFEQWHIYKAQEIDQSKKANDVARRHDQPAPYAETLLQWHTIKELEAQLMGIGKKDSIQIARRQLVQMGVISEHKNPNPRYSFDNTTFYLFHPDQLNQLLELQDQRKIASPPAEGATPMAENRQDAGENRQYTYNSSIDTNIENDINSPATERGGASKPKSKKVKREKQPAAGPDIEWQRWVDVWHNFVKDRNGVAPLINGAQVGALKGLRKYLCGVATPVEGKTPDDAGFAAWEYILKNWDKLDDWQRAQLDLTLVLKKINDILNKLRNGTTTNRGNSTGGAKSGTSQDRVDAIINY